MRNRRAALWGASLVGMVCVTLGVWALRLARDPARAAGLPQAPVGGAWVWGAGLLLVGMGAVALGSGASTRPRRGWRRAAHPLVPLVVITLVAAALRVYRIYATPAGLWLDETDIAKQALEIVNGARPRPWDVARLEVPWLYHYYVALFYKVLGPGYMTVKVPHLLISILTAPVLYLLAREFFGPPVAFLSALVWATMRWSINMSRWGHANTLTLFWFVLVLWLVWRAQQTGRWRYWVLGGVALGLSQYSYQATRSLVPVVAFFLLYRALYPRGYLRRAWPQVAVFWLLFLLVYTPLANTYIHNPNLFLERSRAISIFNPLFTRDPGAALKGNVGKYLGMFFYVGDPNGRHNIPGEPVVDAITAALLVLGLARMVREPLRPRHVLLFLWLAAFFAAGILTTEAPNTFRVYGMTPALALVAGVGLEGLQHLLACDVSRTGGTRSRRAWCALRDAAQVAVPTALVLAAAALNVRLYFGVQATHPGVVGMFNVRPTRVGQYIATLPRDVTIYLDRDFWAFSPIDVINPGRPLTRLKTPFHVPPPPEQQGAVVYILGPDGRLLVPYLQHLYPRAQVEEGFGPGGTYLFTGVRVPAEDVARRGLRGSWWASLSEEDAPPTLQGVTLPTQPPLAPPARAQLVGGLYLPMAGVYGLRVEGATAVRVEVANNVVLEMPDQEVHVPLPGGLVPVRVELALMPGDAPRFLWQVPEQPAWQPIPDSAWYPLDVPQGGLLALWYEGGGFRTRPVAVTHAPILYADNAGNLATAAMRWFGQIWIAESGTYGFGLSSDDGSRLWVDGHLVVDNWGLHGARWVEAPVTLDVGWHRIRIDYVDNGGSHWFEARWARPRQRPTPIPPDVLRWTPEDVLAALAPPENPPPVIRVVDATGQVVDAIGVAAARLQDPRFNVPVGDANFQGWPMKLKDQMYDRGIGVYGPGELEFRLEGRFRRLQGIVGVDTDTYGDAHTQVQIVGDGRVLWDSGLIRPWDPPRTFDVDVSGVQVLVLRQIEEGHFEGRGDGVDWVDIRLTR